MKPHASVSLIAALCLLTLGVAGCATSGRDRASSTSTSIHKAAQSIHRGNGQIDAVLFALTSLVNEPGKDMKAQYAKFDTAVSRLDDLAKDVASESVAMRAKGADYFQNWDMEIATIQNESIRSRSQERKNATAARFEQLRSGYARANAAFAPFMSDMKDIRTALASDLTVGGVAAVRTIANRSSESVPPLRESLSVLEADFTALGLDLSPANPAR